VRYFFSTGEPSGELSATLLATEIASRDERASFEGIGAQRMQDFGFKLWAINRGWGSITPFSVLARVPRLMIVLSQTIRRLLADPPARVVLVDFGAFNLRLAGGLRRRGYTGNIIYYFPPGAWFDTASQARAVANLTVPVPAFRHQYEFYRSLGLAAHYFGHPLASRYQMRESRPPPPLDAGTVALLPGSREAELRHHVPLLCDALQQLRKARPGLRAYAVAVDDAAEARLTRMFEKRHLRVTVVHSTPAALAHADAAWIASGTAVLEAALLGVPSVVFYRMSRFEMGVARRLYRGAYFALPNLVAGCEIVPELTEDEARVEPLVAAIESVLRNPSLQYEALRALRAELGPSDALPRIADLVVNAEA